MSTDDFHSINFRLFPLISIFFYYCVQNFCFFPPVSEINVGIEKSFLGHSRASDENESCRHNQYFYSEISIKGTVSIKRTGHLASAGPSACKIGIFW